MGSLTSCLKKVGAAISADDKATIIERARALRGEGKSNAEAALQATRELYEQVRAEAKAATDSTPEVTTQGAAGTPAPDQREAAPSKPRLAETADDLFAQLKKLSGGHVAVGLGRGILPVYARNPAGGPLYAVEADGKVSVIGQGGMTRRDATREEGDDFHSDLEGDRLWVQAWTRWGGSGGGGATSTKPVVELHSPSGQDWGGKTSKQPDAERQAAEDAAAELRRKVFERRRTERELERSTFRDLLSNPEVPGMSLKSLEALIQAKVGDLVTPEKQALLARAVHKEAARVAAELAKQKHRDPRVQAAAIAEALEVLTNSGPVAPPEHAAAFQAGWAHAMAGKIKSTLSGDLLLRQSIGYDAAKRWMTTEEGAAWYEGRPVNKLQNTGMDLRRWYEQLQEQMKGDESDIQKAWAKIERATNRADLFSTLLPDGVSPGFRLYVTEARDLVRPFKAWLEAAYRWEGSTAFRNKYGRSDKSDFEYMLEGSRHPSTYNYGGGPAASMADAQAFETDEGFRANWLRERAREYVEQVRRIASVLSSGSSVPEAAQKWQETFVSKYSSKRWNVNDSMLTDAGHELRKSGAWTGEVADIMRFCPESDWTKNLIDNEQTVELPNGATPLTPPKLDSIVRDGPDLRKGQDVTPQTMKETFGLADVGFGKWVGAKQDQDHLNYAHDAFMDLAKHFGTDPKNIGFGGRMHLTIGALGRGKFAAHFSPNQPSPVGPVQVINLTNTKGDGTVYHEWIHALDHFLGGQWKSKVWPRVIDLLEKGPMTVERVEATARKFLFHGFAWSGKKRDWTKVDHAVYAMQRDDQFREATAYKSNADKLDSGGKYWSKPEELLARAAEAWAHDTLPHQNTYLQTPWVAEGKVTKAAGYRGTPYPTGSERKMINEVIGALAKSVTWENGLPTVSLADFEANLPKSFFEGDARRKELATYEGMEAYRDEYLAKKAQEKAEAEAEEKRLTDELAEREVKKLEPPPPIVDAPPASETKGPLTDADLEAIFDEAAAEAREQRQEEPDTPPPGDPAAADDGWKTEDWAEIHRHLAKGTPVLLAEEGHGIPTIHEFGRLGKTDMVGFGVFKTVGDGWTARWDGGSAMDRTPSGKAYTTVQFRGEGWRSVYNLQAAFDAALKNKRGAVTPEESFKQQLREQRMATIDGRKFELNHGRRGWEVRGEFPGFNSIVGLDAALSMEEAISAAWAKEVSSVPAPAPAPTPAPSTKKKPAKADPMDAIRAHFTPGNVVNSYGGKDEVLAFKDLGNGNFSVQVHGVVQRDGEWVRVGKPQDARWHSTRPDAKELATGPVDRLQAAPGTKVKYTEPRADGAPFLHAPPRGPAPQAASEKPPANISDATDPTARELIKKAAELGVKGADEALTGLAKLFGSKPGRLNSFPAGFDEESYKEAKPHFEAALKSFQEAGRTLKEFFRFLIDNLGEGVKMYAIQFAKDQALTAQLGSKPSASLQAARDVEKYLLHAQEPLTWQGLFNIADRAWGGKQAAGAYTSKDAYDALEAGINLRILRSPNLFDPRVNRDEAQRTLAALERLLAKVPTQSKRTAEQDDMQQFSTVPTLSFLANWVAKVSHTDLMLEPSAGVGGLAVFAKNAGARVVLNELSSRRAAVLQEVLHDSKVYQENAEQLHNILPDDIKPTVVVMNPPFSNSPTGIKKYTMIGAKHVEQALARLAPGGRLAAIVGEGMGMDKPTFREWWKKIGAKYDVRAAVPLDGAGYAKYGTTFNNVLLVIDKVPPQADRKPVVTPAANYTEAIGLLAEVRDDRPVHNQPSSDRVDPEPDTGRPGSESVPGGGRADAAGPAGDGGAAGVGGGQPGGGSRVGQGGAAGGRSRGGKRPGGAASGNSSDRVPGSQDQDGRGPADAATSGGSDPAGNTTGLTIESKTTEAAGELTDAVFESYTPQRLEVPGAKPHLGPLVQSSAMSSVLPPKATYTPNLPKETIEKGLLSIAQLEAVVYAGQAHEQMLDTKVDDTTARDLGLKAGTPYRRGFFIGDGTGVGKGREISGIILDNIRQGRTKHVWVSEKQELMGNKDGSGEGATRDFRGIGGDPAIIFNQNKTKADGAIDAPSGILFTTYSTLRSGAKSGDTGGFEKGAPVVVQIKMVTFTPGDDGTSTGKLVKIDHKKHKVTVEWNGGKVVEHPMAQVISIGGESASWRTPTASAAKTRLDQIVEWVGPDFDGVIAFDEAHNAGNAVSSKGERGKSDHSEQARAVVDLQKRLPKARVVYVSATGATEVSNLSFATRLGLWGEGTPFSNVRDFISQVAAGGLATMELVARDMKQMGAYLARSLSYEGVQYSRLDHELTPVQHDIYNRLCDAWQVVLNNMEEALKVTGAVSDSGKTENSKAKSAMLSAFWGGNQRFFNQIITSMQMPSVLESVEADIQAGNAVVLQLVNTNEAAQERALAKRKAEDEAADLEDLDLTPRDQLLQMVSKSFPVNQYEDYIDDGGKKATRLAVDSQGNPIVNKAAAAMRDQLLQDLKDITVPDGPLEILVNHFGPEITAEITGRKQRVLSGRWNKTAKSGETPKAFIEKRGDASNRVDAAAFMDDKKRILVFSDAGGTGFSFQADLTKKNQRHRRHYLIQPGWRANKAVQGFGRTHRTNQKSAPSYVLVATNIPAHKRFLSSIARRLDQLGALTKGQRDTSSGGMFSESDNLESKYAERAVVSFFQDAKAGAIQGLDFHGLLKQLGLKDILDPTTQQITESKLPEVRQFLNRLLSLKLEDQNTVFNAFIARMEEHVELARQSGDLDTGMQTLRALETKVLTEEVAYVDERTGAETKYVELELTHPTRYIPFPEAKSTGEKIDWVVNVKSGRVWGRVRTGNTTKKSGEVVERYKMLGSGGMSFKEEGDFFRPGTKASNGSYKDITDDAARELWAKEAAARPATWTEKKHMIVGAMLPIWDRLKTEGTMQVARTNTVDGRRLLGRIIHESDLKEIRKRLNIASPDAKLPTVQIMVRIIKGETADLANGWRLERARVSNDLRIEIIPTSEFTASQQKELTSQGAMYERIGWKGRMFVPTGKPEVLEAILKSKPVIELKGSAPEALKQETAAGAGVPMADLQQLVSQLRNEWAEGGPTLDVVSNVAALPASTQAALESMGATDTTRGLMMPDGRVFLIADKLDSVDEARSILFHEVYGHFGMRAFLKGAAYEEAMTRLRTANPKLAAEANAWYAAFAPGQITARIRAGMSRKAAEKEVRLLAVEEALADRAGDHPPPSWWKDLMAMLIGALRRVGLRNVPDMLERMTEAETHALLMNARRAVKTRPGLPHALTELPATMHPKASHTAPVWYSALLREVGKSPMNAGTPQAWGQYLDALIKRGAVKADEVEWTGLREFLAMQQGKVTKDQIGQFLSGNGVLVTETVLQPSLDTAPAMREKAAGGLPLFSRTEGRHPPPVTIEVDPDTGMPRFLGEQFSLEFPSIQGEDHDSSWVNYVIMPTGGAFQEFGNVTLQIRDGKPVGLSVIKVEEGRRGAGVGRQVVESVLSAAGPDGITVYTMIPKALGFWRKMGTRIDGEHIHGRPAYEGHASWSLYTQGADGSRDGGPGRQRQGQGVQRDTGADPANQGLAREALGSDEEGGTPLLSQKPDPVLAEAKRKAGVGGPRSMRDKVRAYWTGAVGAVRERSVFYDEVRQGTLDQFYGIQRAVKRELGNLSSDLDPYITSRLANGGTSSVMRALLLHGQARWAANGQHLEKIPGTVGLLDILQPLGDDLNDFFGWMVGNRAARLMKEGRENNLTDDEIKALQGLADTPEKRAKFQKASMQYAAFKRSVLDVAEQAGLIDKEARKVWDYSDYIPFYREVDEKAVFSATGRKGLSGQSSGIRILRGGDAQLNDPMENLLMNFSRLIDASLKNNAIRKTVAVLKDSDVIQKIGYDMRPAIVPRSQVMEMLVSAGTPDAVLDALPPEVFDGMAKMWAIQAPADPDVVRIMVDGHPQFYRVHDGLLLKALTSFIPFDFPGLTMMRGAKRLLTAMVTSTPEFMIRNWIRDSMSSQAITRDGFSPMESVRGIGKAWKESGGYEAMLFAGASFQSGNVDAANPEATGRHMRRALRQRGFDASSTDAFMATVMDGTASAWERWRKAGEAIENANREAVYEATRRSGGSVTAAAFEAKDLIDFSLRGSHAVYQVMADVLPFFNARTQGLYRLARSDPRRLVTIGVMMAVVSALIAAINAGEDWYERLPDWDKDTYWHVRIAGEHFRIPKPFEIGVMFATLPERIGRGLMGLDSGKKTVSRVWANVRDQLAIDPVPQLIRPAVDAWANKDTFRDRPIEGMADEGKSPSARSDSRTSATMRVLAEAADPISDATGLSPKKLEFLVNGYFGTVGMYALAVSDAVVRNIDGAPARPSFRADDVPVVRTFYAVDPARATVFESDVYKMRREVEEVFREVNAFAKSAQGEKARALMAANADKLRIRGLVVGGASQLTALNQQINRIYEDRKLTPDQKREAIDKLQERKNAIAQKVATDPKVRAVF